MSGSGYVLEASVWVPAPRSRVFAFFAAAENLQALTPPTLAFRITSPLPIPMEAGALIDYRLALHGIPFRWRTEISAWEPEERFVDRQLRGPYRRWVHEHRFTKEGGGTRVDDRVEYDMVGGRVVHALFVRRQLERIFRFRGREILRRFGGNSGGRGG